MKKYIGSAAGPVFVSACLLLGGGCELEVEDGSEARAPTREAPSSGDGGEESGERSSAFPSNWKWIHGTDISHWPETINLRSVTLHRGSGNIHHVTFDYDRLQDIPPYYVPGDSNNVHNVNGSAWVIREYDGQWYIGTFEYMRVGQRTKEMGFSPAWKLMPRPGDRIGFMLSTINRSFNGTIVTGDPNSPYRERSNIVWVTW